MKDRRACLVGLVIWGETGKRPRVEIPNLRQDEGRGRQVTWFRVWLWPLVDEVEGKSGVRGLD